MNYTSVFPAKGILTPYSFPGIPNKYKNLFYDTHKQFKVVAVEDRFNAIMKAIERVTVYTKDEILSRSKLGLLPTLRAIIAEYLYEPGVVPFVQVAKLLGGRDHTTVIYYIRIAIKKIKNDEYLYRTYKDIHAYL